MKDDQHTDHHQLAAKYFSGNATDAEIRQLEAWVLASPNHKRQFHALRQAWFLSDKEPSSQAINVEAEWQQVAAQISEKSRETPVVPLKRKRSLVRLLSMAAAVAVVVAAGIWLFLPRTEGTLPELTVFSESEVKDQPLTDGSHISLNQFSTVTYSDEADQTRRVTLKGDAFFEVSRNEERPFVVNTPDVTVEVLGTAFYVDSREGQPTVQVIVQSGTVAMKSDTNKVILNAGEIGIYHRASRRLTKKTNDDLNYLAWKTGMLVFESTPLERLVFDLNRTFHAKVSMAQPHLKDCPVIATYKHKSLEAIAQIIAKTLNIKADINGDQIIFSGPPCN